MNDFEFCINYISPEAIVVHNTQYSFNIIFKLIRSTNLELFNNKEENLQTSKNYYIYFAFRIS